MKQFLLFFTSVFVAFNSGAFTCDEVFFQNRDLKTSHQLNAVMARTLIKNNGDGPGFETRRALDVYVKMMPQKFQDQIEILLMKGGRFLDSGSGEGLALSHLKIFDDQNLIEAVGVTARMEGDPRLFEKPGLRFIADGRLLEEIPLAELGQFDLIVDNYGPYAYSSDPVSVFLKYLRMLNLGGQLFIQTGHRDRQLVEKPEGEITATITLETYLEQKLSALVERNILKIEVLDSVGTTLGQSNKYEPYRVLSIELLKKISDDDLALLKPLLVKELNPGNPPYKLLSQ